MSFKKQLIAIISICSLSACTTTYKTEDKNWAVNNGPTISEVVQLEALTPKQVFNIFESKKDPKGKFETEEEYKSRIQKIGDTFFMVLPLKTTDVECKTSYNHEKNLIKVSRCSPERLFGPMYEEQKFGETIKLANAFDTREVKTLIIDKYNGYGSIVGRDFEYEVPRSQAAEFEKNLMFGLLIKVKSINKSCNDCQLRALNDLTVATGKGKISDWKNDAFKSGLITETTNHDIFYDVKKLLIFNKSNNKILSQVDFTVK